MKLFYSLFFLLFLSCAEGNKTGNSAQSKANLFKLFLQKFETTQLPYQFRLTDVEPDKIDHLKSVDFNSIDSLFLPSKDIGKAFCKGILADTSHFYALIFLYPGDSYYPVLITYSKNGEIISEENLLANGCSPDCGLKRYSINCKINPNFTIMSSDTSIWEYRCDSLGQPILNSAFTWIDTKVGKVDSEGKIQLSQTTRQEIKN